MCALLTFSEYFDLPMRDVGNLTTLRNNCIFFKRKTRILFSPCKLGSTWLWPNLKCEHTATMYFSVSVPPLPIRFLDDSDCVLKLIEMEKKKKEKTKKKVTNYLENVKKVCWRDRGRSNKLVPNKLGKVKECYAVFRLRVNKRISKRTRKSLYRTFPNRPKKKRGHPGLFLACDSTRKFKDDPLSNSLQIFFPKYSSGN